MTAVTERFTGHAAAYAAARPSYPQTLATDLQQRLHLPDTTVVADLGSGTGLSSEIFLRIGWTVLGVEPNAAMRATAENYLARIFHQGHETCADAGTSAVAREGRRRMPYQDSPGCMGEHLSASPRSPDDPNWLSDSCHETVSSEREKIHKRGRPGEISGLASYAKFRSVHGTAEDTTLPERSVDLVVAAQAAHWFDAPRARIEALRILRPPAWAALIWNERLLSEDNAFAQGYEQLLRDWGSDYTQVRSRHANRELITTFLGGAPLHTLSYSHALMLDENALRTLVASASYMPQPGAPTYEAMMDHLHRLFVTTQTQGQVRMDYVARVYAGHVCMPVASKLEGA